jgi:dihydrodipicolinate synthase/N-acetylneuraminate lyase
MELPFDSSIIKFEKEICDLFTSMIMNGIWLPIITPFKDGKVDFNSYKRLIDYSIKQGIDGIIPLGTTGEVSTLYDR